MDWIEYFHAAYCHIHTRALVLFPKQLPDCRLENRVQHASWCIQTHVIILIRDTVVIVPRGTSCCMKYLGHLRRGRWGA